MSGEAMITLTGNLASDPDLKFVGDEGTPLLTFPVYSTPRVRKNGVWQDGVTLKVRVKCWRNLAEALYEVEDFRKGCTVTVTGLLTREEWTAKDSGEVRDGLFVTADHIGITPRKKGNADGFQGTQAVEEDPW